MASIDDENIEEKVFVDEHYFGEYLTKIPVLSLAAADSKGLSIGSTQLSSLSDDDDVLDNFLGNIRTPTVSRSNFHTLEAV